MPFIHFRNGGNFVSPSRLCMVESIVVGVETVDSTAVCPYPYILLFSLIDA